MERFAIDEVRRIVKKEIPYANMPWVTRDPRTHDKKYPVSFKILVAIFLAGREFGQNEQAGLGARK